MLDELTEKPVRPFPTIEKHMVDRLVQEAEARTLRPQRVDWAEIHNQAALARTAQ